MKKILAIRQEIYEQFHSSDIRAHYFLKQTERDTFAAYETSMLLIQDTAESVDHLLEKGISDNPWDSYIEFWGLMQALFIQQDAICELYESLLLTPLNTRSLAAWKRLRETRNLCAGHPAKRRQKSSQNQRAFMGRNFGSLDSVKVEVWDSERGYSSHPTFDLRTMIIEYDKEAAVVLGAILRHMQEKWPKSQ